MGRGVRLLDVTVLNVHGQPLGDPLEAWSGCSAPVPVRLQGRYVVLEPLTGDHADDLFATLAGPTDTALWTYRNDEPPPDVAQLRQRLAAAPAGWVSLAIRPLDDAAQPGAASGMASWLRADPANGAVEIGSILFGRTLQRTRAATEAMYLMARHIFDDLGYRRYEWKCDSRNEPSRLAALRLGFRYEGRFRQHLVYKGRNRDTDWFALTDADWPPLRAAYERWLDPANFIGGVQQVALSTLTTPTPDTCPIPTPCPDPTP